MVDIDKLREVIDSKGLRTSYIVQKSGIDRYTLYNRLKGKGEFTANEIVGLTKALGLTKAERDSIFLS